MRSRCVERALNQRRSSALGILLPAGKARTLRRVQPFYEVTLSRPWHWGIAIVSATGAAVPESLEESLVTATSEALVIKVRHAQDIEADRFEGEWDWATATIRVRSLTNFEDLDEPVAYEGVLRLPEGRMAIGDADSEVTLNDLNEATRVRVYASDQQAGATDVRIDLAPRSR